MTRAAVKIVIILSLLAVVIVSVAGCTYTTTQQTNQSIGNTPTTNNGIEVTVKALQSPSEISGEAASPGYKWVVYNTTVTNVNAPNRVITRNISAYKTPRAKTTT